MVSGTTRNTRFITFLAFGSLSIAAATLYFILLRNRKQEKRKPQPKAEQTSESAVESTFEAVEALVELTPDSINLLTLKSNPEESEKLQEESEKLQETSEKLQEKLEKPQEESEKVQEESEKLQEESEKLQEESEKLQEESEKLQEESEKLQEEVNFEEKMSQSQKSESGRDKKAVLEQVVEEVKEETPDGNINSTEFVVITETEPEVGEDTCGEEIVEQLIVKNCTTLPEREPTPMEKMLASESSVGDWAECSEPVVTATDNAESSAEPIPIKNETTVVINISEATSSATTATDSYKLTDSPSVDSNHSEISNDSGRATVMPPPLFHPFDYDIPALPMYEFEVPNTLVGLIIGIQGKTIRELCSRADVRILIRPHHDSFKLTSHQICSIEGKRDDINKCLHMMRHRFPPHRFPDLNLKPVFPPPTQPPMFPSQDMMQLSLPAGAPCEVYISALVDAGHFFVQLPTHPTFPSLTTLDSVMNSIYNRSIGLPEYARPPKNAVNVMCAAPASNGWYRAVTLCYDEKQDEMLVKFVDYGGFARMPRADLRFLLRQDVLSLPFQSIEVYLADVEPIDGVAWSEEANAYFSSICTQKIVSCELIGHSRYDGLPFVRLFTKNYQNETVRVDKLLLTKNFAKVWDQNRCSPLPIPRLAVTATTMNVNGNDTVTPEAPQINGVTQTSSNHKSKSNKAQKKFRHHTSIIQ